MKETIRKFESFSGDDDDDEKEVHGEPKKKKEKKIFQVGDVLICTKTTSKKLSQECMEFLKTFTKFKVLAVNANHNIDIGYRTSDGNSFFFSPNRFDLKDAPPTPPVEAEKINPKNLEDKLKRVMDSDSKIRFVPGTGYEAPKDDFDWEEGIEGWK